MIFILTNVIYIVYDRTEERKSLALLITHYSEYKYPYLSSILVCQDVAILYTISRQIAIFTNI